MTKEFLQVAQIKIEESKVKITKLNPLFSVSRHSRLLLEENIYWLLSRKQNERTNLAGVYKSSPFESTSNNLQT